MRLASYVTLTIPLAGWISSLYPVALTCWVFPSLIKLCQTPMGQQSDSAVPWCDIFPITAYHWVGRSSCFHATTTAVFSPFSTCPFCSWCEFWVFSHPVSLHLVTKPQSHHSLSCQMCCVRFSLVGFLQSKETTKNFCGSRNTSLLSQGALERGFGLFISKGLQTLTVSGITEQEEDTQKCLKVLKVLKGYHFSTKSPANIQAMPGGTASSIF